MFRINLCLVLLVSIFLFSACSTKVIKIFPSDNLTDEEKSRNDATAAELERNRRLWQESKINDYDFELERFAEGMGGDWTRTFIVRENKTLPQNDTYASYQYLNKNSVEKLFDYIQEGLEKEQEVNIFVTFNKEFGFPESIRTGSKRSNAYESLKIKKLEIVK